MLLAQLAKRPRRSESDQSYAATQRAAKGRDGKSLSADLTSAFGEPQAWMNVPPASARLRMTLSRHWPDHEANIPASIGVARGSHSLSASLATLASAADVN